MNIGITTGGADGGRSGIGSYAVNVMRQFAVLGSDHRFEVFGHRSEEAQLGRAATGLPGRIVHEGWRRPVLNVAWHQTMLPLAVRSRRYDVLFLPAANRRIPVHCGCPTVGTVHDLSSLHVAGKYDPARELYIRRVLPALYRRLTHIITPSESTRRDLIDHALVPADRITVIPLAADHDLYYPRGRAASRQFAADRYGLHAPFVLYTARIEHPGKNHVRLIEAFDEMKQRTGLPHDLVFVGPERERAAEVRAAARRARFAAHIKFLGFVPTADLPLLYSAADLVTLPSLYEGFGLPVLEAMACGAAVACSNLSSLPEVAGRAAAQFDPCDVRGMARLLDTLLNDETRRAELGALGRNQARRFSWDAVGRRTLEVLEAAAARTTRNTTNRQNR